MSVAPSREAAADLVPRGRQALEEPWAFWEAGWLGCAIYLRTPAPASAEPEPCFSPGLLVPVCRLGVYSLCIQTRQTLERMRRFPGSSEHRLPGGLLLPHNGSYSFFETWNEAPRLPCRCRHERHSAGNTHPSLWLLASGAFLAHLSVGFLCAAGFAEHRPGLVPGLPPVSLILDMAAARA